MKMVIFSEKYDYDTLGYVPTMAEFLETYPMQPGNTLVHSTAAGIESDNADIRRGPHRFKHMIAFILGSGYKPLHIEYNGGDIMENEWGNGKDYIILFTRSEVSFPITIRASSAWYSQSMLMYPIESRMLRFANNLSDKSRYPFMYLVW